MSSNVEKQESALEIPPPCNTPLKPASEIEVIDLDRGVIESVSEALDGHVWLPNYIDFFVKDGRVTLTGQVTWDYERRSAEHNIKKIEGVRQVVNKIELIQTVDSKVLKRPFGAKQTQQARFDVDVTYVIAPNGKLTLWKRTFMA